MLQRYERCVSLREGESLSQHPHDDRAVLWHVLAVDDLESGEECPDPPLGKLSNNLVGDVDFGHVDDGACQTAGDLSGKQLKIVAPQTVNVRPRGAPKPLTSSSTYA